ncbi:amidohydrolase family protein [Sphingobacterium sp. SGG-5]|uniref:amidohydrolase family protein n=1 Tax=Sphingobacterium sp. SGG-5 TaxID=2710881 RepID=UPI0013EDE6E5|nr:amidohydrolase family protein [Sphingobacterium sp. SGG-5]NGM60691.1 amidohydrolase family protein [Sphingobacterium sp. SGG-5]
MLKYYSADYVLPISSPPIRNGIVAIDQNGVIRGLYSSGEAPLDAEVTRLSGALIPGFVNGHCHLELSHLKDKIPPKSGLVDFILQVMRHRDDEKKGVEKAMKKADDMMYANGIQAVGDHVNSSVSAPIKENSKMMYHTFVEVIGLQDDLVEQKIDEARDVEYYFDPDHSSITPHAPYSCSKALLRAFKRSVSERNIISVHNQESEEENKFFRYNTGDFQRFYAEIGIDLSVFKAQARNSLQSYLPYLPTNNKIILVHNTFTTVKDLDFAQRMGKKVILCICPKANLYIEDTLPKLNLLQQDADIIMGTDSLASNDTLDMLEELKVLHKHYPELSFVTTIQWATLNGAKALGMDEQLGSLEVGKAPGLILLKNMKQLRLVDAVKVERVV